MMGMSEAAAAGPRYRLEPPAAASPIVLDEAQRAVVAHAAGPLLVRGGPGTGKTEALVAAATARVADGVDPASLLVFGLRRQDTAVMRSRINAEAASLTAAEVGVLTFPAFAFAVLRAAAVRDGRGEPRLLTGPEADALIRSMLADEDFGWPEGLAEALQTYAFAQQLRDLVLRSGERGLDEAALAELGRRHDRPEWIAAARFYERYTTVLAVQSIGSALYDSAEIIRAAVAELRRRPDLVDPPAWVLVDDLQDATPAHVDLLELLAGRGANLIAAGCPDAAVFGYQGGDPEAVRDFPDRFATVGGEDAPVVRLDRAPSTAQVPRAATVSLPRRRRGPDRDRHRRSDREDEGRVDVQLLPSPTREATSIADTVRRAHLLDGVAYDDIAVLVKSASSIPALRRALHHAGVPTRQGFDFILSRWGAMTNRACWRRRDLRSKFRLHSRSSH
jgi:superfamily I DNA/RNA helicase